MDRSDFNDGDDRGNDRGNGWTNFQRLKSADVRAAPILTQPVGEQF